MKESAIAGVGSSPWVGVDRAKKIAASASGSEFVIYSDLDHKRNYLEACLCDAAIGLKGGDGTISEVTFSLSLQRPVALVGDHWKRDGSLDGPDRPAVLASMVDRAFVRVGRNSSGRPDLDVLLNERAIRDGLTELPRYAYLSSNAPENVVDWILEVLSSRQKAGHFPPLKDYQDVTAEYQRWLTKYAV